MAKKLFVANLPFSVGDDELHNTFSNHGEVLSAKVVTDRNSGKSKGFGFVEMADEGAADSAIQSLNNSEMAGRKIAVSEARPQAPREGGGGRGGFGGRGGGGGGGRHRHN
jgi:RNA recognition motif-containing protein